MSERTLQRKIKKLKNCLNKFVVKARYGVKTVASNFTFKFSLLIKTLFKEYS
ncbi:MAG: hypothetical protein ACUVRG_11530 [Ignavibacterium sp.]|uniref:hypothetical protein n=1 Tax=Ignavibacterium sp. TaxID=2651167 RepID=UPI00404A71BE